MYNRKKGSESCFKRLKRNIFFAIIIYYSNSTIVFFNIELQWNMAVLQTILFALSSYRVRSYWYIVTTKGYLLFKARPPWCKFGSSSVNFGIYLIVRHDFTSPPTTIIHRHVNDILAYSKLLFIIRRHLFALRRLRVNRCIWEKYTARYGLRENVR